jgi:hypothetical protein
MENSSRILFFPSGVENMRPLTRVRLDLEVGTHPYASSTQQTQDLRPLLPRFSCVAVSVRLLVLLLALLDLELELLDLGRDPCGRRMREGLVVALAYPSGLGS